jgi:hypothetical protein
MRLALALAAVVILANCAALPGPNAFPASPCDVSKASYECQVEQYQNVNVQ